MHPVNKDKFGTQGLMVRYYNTATSAIDNGYVVKQPGTYRYVVSNGTINNGVLQTQTCTLAQTATQVSSLGSGESSICTIEISTNTGGTGATFTATYGVDSSTTISSGGAGWTTGNAIVVTGGVRPSGTVTVATNPQANDTLTLGGTATTFVATGATGAQVNIGASAALTATNLYNYLIASADTNLVKCNYVQNGTAITLISKTTGTTNNAFAMVTASGGRITVSGATLTGGVVDFTGIGTPPTISATATTGAVTSLTISAPGSVTSFPTNPVFGYFAGNGHTPVHLTLKYKLVSVATSGGTGYATGETLNFVGMSSTLAPNAHVSAVTSGVPSAVVVDSAGSGITTKASSIGALGALEHVRVLYDSIAETVEGHRYHWTLGTSVNGSAIIPVY